MQLATSFFWGGGRGEHSVSFSWQPSASLYMLESHWELGLMFELTKLWRVISIQLGQRFRVFVSQGLSVPNLWEALSRSGLLLQSKAPRWLPPPHPRNLQAVRSYTSPGSCSVPLLGPPPRCWWKGQGLPPGDLALPLRVFFLRNFQFTSIT